MANLLRLISSALLFAASAAHALISPVYGWKLRGVTMSALLFFVGGSAVAATPSYQYQLGNQPWFSSKQASCADYMAYAQKSAPANHFYFSPKINEAVGDYGGCYWSRSYADTGESASDALPTAFKRRDTTGMCLQDMEPGPDGQCACKAGTHQVGELCVPNDDCQSKMGSTPTGPECTGGQCQYSYKVPANGSGMTVSPYGRYCKSNCTVKGDLDFCGQAFSGVMVAGMGTCQVSGSYFTGDKCTGSGEVKLGDTQDSGKPADPSKTETEANPAPKKLPPGKCPGTVNGVDVVVDCSDTASVEKKKEDDVVKKNPDGSTTIEKPGSTTTKTTICQANACTTTTTVTTGGSGSNGSGTGSSTTTTKETQGKDEFCAANKSNKACGGSGDKGEDKDKDPGSFGGSCGGGFKAVSDDAVQNAMAEEMYRQNCKLTPDNDSTSLAAAERVKSGNMTGDNPNNDSVSLSGSSFDTSDALNAGSSCIADKAITVFGGTAVTLPFSRACDGFPVLGTLLLALSFLVAGVIILRG